ncbi:2-C-methyl-D-erythritol 2,4-cyclodiphosphate synthase [Listeria sp. PSOL-1]|uniref:2-C-methyl-D-erythritol 2,4-cyclodiphosphate synthase n=1 Tax=Listeria sp. PSOL-1 TaxID=1844999 RepID=UPI0013D2BA53|nr:2-C-methyl-D-erythritol 2,4-cyclodiphosphate synthase [Listeria sp. PSOL-1]
MIRIGQGYDTHQLIEGRSLIIGGITIPYEKGLLGHSDADVLLHAVTDAVIGATGKRDIGYFFPDTDVAYKDANSAELLSQVWQEVEKEGYRLGNIDCTILAEKPKMAPYIEDMKKRIAELLHASSEQINVKATTSEKMGFVGRGEGITSLAVVLLEK